ncbi:hypothetical protein TREMEDRAFT_33158, partial [Tremella mesenterica DSM 1558]|uniref:uncharacterized protein n=1 Tax=Tremella mesenterica (strain ATCC 24925 / CBS 8224 / DSM 1558 / NBRC 9311 / NRRL Y-6157 / RJB 2259-6 / UBC 559-6) TaxID=578456 RepID=UPI0003F48F8A
LMGMPHPLGSSLAFGVGTGIDNTAAAWRRYYGLGGWLTGYHSGFRMPGRPGLGGYFGVSVSFRPSHLCHSWFSHFINLVVKVNQGQS